MKNIITNKYLLGLLMFLAWIIPLKKLLAATTNYSFFQGSNALVYVNVVYTWGSLMVGALALVVITYAGINYMRSFGNSEVISRSKELIAGGLIGLFLVFGGYFILRLMDPRLVELKLTIPKVALNSADIKACIGYINDQSCKIPGATEACSESVRKICAGIGGLGMTVDSPVGREESHVQCVGRVWRYTHEQLLQYEYSDKQKCGCGDQTEFLIHPKSTCASGEEIEKIEKDYSGKTGCTLTSFYCKPYEGTFQ